ncbi:hypothetical protein NPIL_34471 [Nephila pilipes]|uniref:Uncharacterized protein n=1 Tax=Nephila pilipes TaxID=299642 RepID=A0A8X6N9N1_NEPPI|nr:hypothetical protein NPIL_34471 [Nephila pilipes]
MQNKRNPSRVDGVCIARTHLTVGQRFRCSFRAVLHLICVSRGENLFQRNRRHKSRLLFEMESFQTPRARAGNQSVVSSSNQTEVPGMGVTGNGSSPGMTELVSYYMFLFNVWKVFKVYTDSAFDKKI